MSKHKLFSQELLVSKPEPSFTNLVLPPGKRNIRRKLKITSKVEKKKRVSVGALWQLKGKRHNCVWRKVSICQEDNEWIGTKTLYHSDLHNLEELHRGGTWQGAGLETHAWEVALWAKKDPRRSVAHERPTPDRAEVGSMDQQRKTAVHWPQCHVSPVTSLKGRGRDCMQHAVRIREVGTGKGGREVLDWSWGWGRKGISISVVSLDILFFSSVAKLVIKICVKWVWIKLNEICWVKTVLPATRGLHLFSIFTQLWAAFFCQSPKCADREIFLL